MPDTPIADTEEQAQADAPRIVAPELADRCSPAWSPPFGGPPYQMIFAELAMVEFETDRAEIERITPPMLEPAEHNRLVAFVGHNSQLSHSLDYHEVAILQPVSYQGRSGVTIPYIWTSTDTALIAGRDLYGMPKMICDDERLHKWTNEVTGHLHRDGERMLSLNVSLEGPAGIETLPFGADFICVRHIPSPDPDWPALRQLIWVTLEDFKMEFCWTGRGHLDIGMTGSSGLGRLKPEAVTGAWYGRFSWTLNKAKVLQEDKLYRR